MQLLHYNSKSPLQCRFSALSSADRWWIFVQALHNSLSLHHVMTAHQSHLGSYQAQCDGSRWLWSWDCSSFLLLINTACSRLWARLQMSSMTETKAICKHSSWRILHAHGIYTAFTRQIFCKLNWIYPLEGPMAKRTCYPPSLQHPDHFQFL